MFDPVMVSLLIYRDTERRSVEAQHRAELRMAAWAARQQARRRSGTVRRVLHGLRALVAGQVRGAAERPVTEPGQTMTCELC